MADISLSADVDTSGVAAGMAAIENQVQRTGQSFASKFSSLFAAGAIIAEIDKVLNAAEEVHKQAARFDIDAEQFEKVANSAKELGISSETVARALNFMEIAAQKAIDPTTKEALAMENMGISAVAFAAASPWEKVLMLSDAYGRAADKQAFYADAAAIVNRRSTEFLALIAQGPDKIQELADKFPLLSKSEIGALTKIKEEEKKYVADLDSWVAKAIVTFGRLFTYVKQGFDDWDKSFPKWSVGPLVGPLVPAAPAPAPRARPSPEPTVPDGGGGGGGGESDITGFTARLRLQTAGLDMEQKMNALFEARQFLQDALNAGDESSAEHAATQYQIKKQIRVIDTEIATLAQQLNIEETKGVQLADEKIQKSKDRVTIDELEMQLQAAEVNGNVVLAQQIQSQIDQTRIELDFNEKIQKALDDANVAREHGLKDTAAENEALAVQLETEKQITLEQQAQTDQLKARAAFAVNLQRSTDAFGIMAREGINMGGTDTYAAALAASRGLKPGTPAYNRLVQQIKAQDELRILSGQNLSSADQMFRDQLMNWYAGQQQGRISLHADQMRQQELDYWGAIASGRMPAANNPYIGQFGLPNLVTGQFTTPSDPNQIAAYLLAVFQGQGVTLQQILATLQRIDANTTVVTVP